jgi:hypothetical protein
MIRFGFPLTVLAVLAVCVVSRRWDDQLSFRHGLTQEMKSAGEALNRVPEAFGAWQAQSNQPIPEQAASVLQCAGSFVRRYVNPANGEIVDAVLIVGPPGPTSVHTPEICYSSRDFQIVGNQTRLKAGADQSSNGELWQTLFQPVDPRMTRLRVVHGWNDGHGWQAPDHPRFTFSAAPLLYKLQVSTFADDAQSQAGLERFLSDFLPVLDKTLFATPETPARVR